MNIVWAWVLKSFFEIKTDHAYVRQATPIFRQTAPLYGQTHTGHTTTIIIRCSSTKSIQQYHRYIVGGEK